MEGGGGDSQNVTVDVLGTVHGEDEEKSKKEGLKLHLKRLMLSQAICAH